MNHEEPNETAAPLPCSYPFCNCPPLTLCATGHGDAREIAADIVVERPVPSDGCHSIEELEGISLEAAASLATLSAAVLERPQFDHKEKATPFSGFVPAHEILNAAAGTFKERNAIYGDNYLMVGKIMKALFPEGVVLLTEDDWNRYHLFELIIVKLSRFAISGLRHQDSIRDMTVYCAMVESLIHPESRSLGGANPFPGGDA